MAEYVDTIDIGSDGAGSITLEAGEYELTGSASGYESTVESVTLDSNQSVTIALSGTASDEHTLELQIQDENGTPLADITASITRLDDT